MIGGFLFILIQLVLIIDFAHSWAEAWVGNYEENESKGWLAALVTVMFTCYGLSLAAIVVLYYFYTGEHTGDCKLHEFFISFNMLLCVGLSIISILPQVQELTGGDKLLTRENGATDTGGDAETGGQ